MILVRTVEPSVEPITVASMATYLRSLERDGPLIADLISSARDQVENAIGKALISQQWVMYVDSWDMKAPFIGNEQNVARPYFVTSPSTQFARYQQIKLPRPPLVAVNSVQYYDSTNILQTLDPATYTIRPSSRTSCGGIVLAYGYSWPTTANRPDAIKIAFTAGYGADPTTVPPRITQALRFLVKHYYDNRDSVIVERATVDELPMTVRDLLISEMIEFVS